MHQHLHRSPHSSRSQGRQTAQPEAPAVVITLFGERTQHHALQRGAQRRAEREHVFRLDVYHRRDAVRGGEDGREGMVRDDANDGQAGDARGKHRDRDGAVQVEFESIVF